MPQTAKQKVLDLVEQLPEHASWSEVVAVLYVPLELGVAIEQADRGELIPQDAVERGFEAHWRGEELSEDDVDARYVQAKIAAGTRAIEQGRVTSHSEVRRRLHSEYRGEGGGSGSARTGQSGSARREAPGVLPDELAGPRREDVLALAASFPDDVSWEEVAWRVWRLRELSRGRADLEAGRVHDHEAVRRRFLGPRGSGDGNG